MPDPVDKFIKCKGGIKPMKNYPNPLDDYTDQSPSLALEIVKYIMPRIIFVAGLGLILSVCAYLEVL
jgi:hypothetical protein